MLVDNCAMQLVSNPRQFDVILTENMFGDILSDEASMITGLSECYHPQVLQKVSLVYMNQATVQHQISQDRILQTQSQQFFPQR